MSNQSLYSSIWCDSTQILQTCSNSAASHVILHKYYKHVQIQLHFMLLIKSPKQSLGDLLFLLRFLLLLFIFFIIIFLLLSFRGP